jgi:hypothetical protein
MKKIIPVLLILAYSAFGQNYSQLKLENDIKSNLKEYKINNSPSVFDNVQLKKSAGLAIIYSLLLPGMGELYADSYSSGKYFTIAEGVLWGTYFGINTYGNWQKERYRSYAASYGGVDLNGKGDTYFSTIGDYQNIDEYNNLQALDRNFDKILSTSDNYWKWQSNNDRKTYRSMWVSSEQSYNNLRFVVGAMIVNRILSAINAVRLVSAYNKQLTTETSWNLSMGVINNFNLPTTLTLNFNQSF